MSVEKRSVVALVELGDLILVGKKKSISESQLSGLWHIPGEKVKEGETDFEAVVRCLQEEANLQVEVVECLGSRQAANNVTWYRCLAYSGEINAGSDLEEVMWVDRSLVVEICNLRAFQLWPGAVLDLLAAWDVLDK